MCEIWQESFEAFADWAIRNGWKPGLQLDRSNNDGNYEPSNCRFVTPSVNCRNSENTPGKIAAAKRNIRQAITASTRLTEQQVRDILEDKRQNSEIALQYGIAAPYVSQIRNGEVWKSITANNQFRRGHSGVFNSRAKLTEAAVLMIVADPRKQADIAHDFGISESQVGAIKSGRRWGHVTGICCKQAARMQPKI